MKNGDNPEELLVIAADTMVTMGSEIFGKPKDATDAVRMLTRWLQIIHLLKNKSLI